MNRRFFIASSLSAGVLAVSGIAAWQLVPRNKEDLSVEAMLKQLQAMDASTMSFESVLVYRTQTRSHGPKHRVFNVWLSYA